MKEFPIEKYHFYRQGNKVIAVSTYAGRTVRGVAICADDDEFDFNKGATLAAARCNLKVARKRMQRAYRETAAAANEYNKAFKRFNKMLSYRTDSIVAFEAAKKALRKLEK